MLATNLPQEELIRRLRRSKSCWIDLNHYMRNESTMRFKDFEYLQKLLTGVAESWRDLEDV
jgi:hypothetical protein